MGARSPVLIFICVAALFFHYSCSKESSSILYQGAEELLSKGEYAKAIEGYLSLVDQYPDSDYAPMSSYKVGLIYNTYIKDADKAVKSYLALILMYPDSKEVRLARRDMAEIYSRKGDYRKAVGEYQWLVENSSGEERSNFRYSIAMEYQRLGDYTQAIIELRDIQRDSPSSPLLPKIYYQIATNQYLDGDLSGALETYTKIISRYPEDPAAVDAALGKAVVLEEAGMLKEAMKVLEALENDYPNNDVIKLRLSWLGKRIKEVPSVRKRRR